MYTRRRFESTHGCVRSGGGREKKKKFSRATEVVYFERLKRQHRLEPPPRSLLTLPFSCLLHHLPSLHVAIDVYICKYTRTHEHVFVHVAVTFVLTSHEEAQSGTRTFHDVCLTFHNCLIIFASRCCFKHFCRFQATSLLHTKWGFKSTKVLEIPTSRKT